MDEEVLIPLAILCFFATPIMLIVVLVKLHHLKVKIGELTRNLTSFKSGAQPVTAEASKVSRDERTTTAPASNTIPSPQPAKPAYTRPDPHPSVTTGNNSAPTVVESTIAASAPQPAVSAVARQPLKASGIPPLPAATPPAIKCDEPSAVDVFWNTVSDWLAVRGKFATSGMSREFAFASGWLVRIGVMLLVCSIIYFVKLSIDRGWMGPTGRVIATVLWGAVGAIGGVALVKRTKYALIGHAVAALGVVALYLGFGLGHRFFDPPVIASPIFAFLSLVLVTVFAGIVSIALPSSTIAVMALVGGYLVPLVAGTETDSPLGLYGYLIVLNAGAFVVARLRKWSLLDFLAAIFADIMGFAWCEEHNGADSGALLLTFVFFVLIHALYLASVIVGAKKRGRAGNAIAWSGLAVNACILLGWLASYFKKGTSSEITGLVFLGLVAAYLAAGIICRRRNCLDRIDIGILVFFALVFLSLAPLLIFDTIWCVVSWSAIAVAVSEAGRKSNDRFLDGLAIVIFAVAAIAGLFYLMPNEYRLGWRIQASHAMYARALFFRLVRIWTLPIAGVLIGRRTKFRAVFVTALVIGFILYTLEAHLFDREFLAMDHRGGVVTVAWTVLAFAGIWLGLARRVKPLRITMLCLLAAAVVKLLIFDTARLDTPVRVVVFALTGLALLVGSFLYIRFKERFDTNG